MGVIKEIDFESFDDIVNSLQEESIKKNRQMAQDISNIKLNSSKRSIQTTKYNKKDTKAPKKISTKNDKKIIRFPIGRILEKEKKETTGKSDKNKKNNKYDTLAKKEEIKQTNRLAKKAKKSYKERRRIANIGKQIEKNVARATRYTAPKKRNLLTRIILQEELSKGYFDDIEFNYDTFSQEEIDRSKNAIKKSDRSLYREVQAYEDAKEDVTVKRGWTTFKVGLATSMLATSLALAGHMVNQIQKGFEPQVNNQIVSLETMDIKDRLYYEGKAENFIEEIRENDGYEFVNLDISQIADGYYRIYNKEKKMSENMFKSATYNLKDQEFLDKIVSDSFGEKYETFSDEEKRDYRQIAFELLPISLPEIFKERNNYIRNPIVYDVVDAKKNAQEKGYRMELIVNSDKKDAVRNIGRLLYLENTLKEQDYQSIDSTEKSQAFLDEMVKKALDDKYENTSKKDLRDYKQLAYELLPDEAKGTYIKDPFEIEKTNYREIGD